MKDIFLIVIAPLILSNVIHIILVKQNRLATWAIPVQESLFGKNKTWRGFLVLPILNAVFAATVNYFFAIGMTPQTAFVIGEILGLVYLLSELPNSWLKRKLGIEAGQPADKHAPFFMLMDKTDSSFGVSLAALLIFGLSFLEGILLFLVSSAVHVGFSLLLVALRIKKRF